jgi:glycosyltransferase involved in cell wall biosynthesis
MSESDINRAHMPRKIEGGKRLRGGDSRPQPLVSIITVVFRAGHELRPLIDSVLCLKDENTEFIVVDGGSEDGTREILKEYERDIDYWVSEPDCGIYDAMNKGIASAQGTFIFHLNAGDRLLYIPIRELKAANSDSVDVAAFRVLIDGKFEFLPSYTISLRFNNTLHHQGTFFRRQSLPAYDTKYKIFADFDVNQKLALRGARVAIFDPVVALHMADGVSNIPNRAAISEFFHVIENNYGITYLPIAWILCKWRGLISRFNRVRRRG